MAKNEPRSIDRFATLVQECATIEQLFALYDAEMQREGYQNIVFARVNGRVDQLEVPYGKVPEGDAKLYFQERMWEHDPVLAASQTTALPFTWIDILMRKSLSEAARRVMDLSAAIGVQGGFTIPFHRPGGQWDLISLSMRDQSLLDAARIPFVTLKTLGMMQRYLELEERAAQRQNARDRIVSAATGADGCNGHSHGASCKDGCVHPQHGDSVGTIDDEACRALVLVDIAWRRYSAGFLDLNERVPDIIGNGSLKAFVDRGLIEEEPDDFRFAYVFKPSPVGRSHLKSCPCVTNWRDEVWDNYVEVHERPAD